MASYNGGIFSSVEFERPGRSVFNLSYKKEFDCDFGQLIPVMCDEISPGMHWKINTLTKVRLMPLNAPVFGDIKASLHYFFVPYRLLWDNSKTDNWEEFITGGDYEPGKFDTYDGLTDIEPPRWTSPNTDVYSLWDYLGFPTGITPTQDALLPLSFPKRGYNLTFNEFYRDEDLQEEVDLDDDNILLRNRKKDYFNSARPWQQKGKAIALPVNTTGKVVFDSSINSAFVPPVRMFYNEDGTLKTDNQTLYMSQTGGDDVQRLPGRVGTLYDPDKHLGIGTRDGSSQLSAVNGRYFGVDFTQSLLPTSTSGVYSSGAYSLSTILGSNTLDAVTTSFTIADMRMAFQLQKWMERNARTGNRYIEYLKSNFAVSPKDERLQRPEYIGGSVFNILVSEVLQTSESTDTSAQGNMTGHGIGAGKSNIGSYYATEYGLILGLLSIMPSQSYMQGVNRQWLRKTRYDFYNPVFANLSEQKILKGEVYYTGTIADEDGFGFQGMYDELRYKPNLVCGALRTDLFDWTMARKFDTAPELNEAFIEQSPEDMKHIFIEQTRPKILVQHLNQIRAVQPMPYHAQPGLIDHF